MVGALGGALDLTRQISCQPPLRMPMGSAVSLAIGPLRL